MGIPLYFRFLTQKYPKTIIDLSSFQGKINELYYDLNGLIHPACQKARKSVENKGCSRQHIENQMHNAVFYKIEEILNLIDPKNIASLSVDGVAPLAKINQQRSRRYKSHILSTMINKVKERHGEMVDKWDTNAISPGTNFMNELMDKLEKYVHDKNKLIMANMESESEPLQLELSTSNQPGEGEHKIFKKIRDSELNHNPEQPYHRLIYGLDADLIMLSLVSGKRGIYLLRESVHFGKVKEDEFLLLDIDLLRECLCSEVRGYLPNINISDTQIINDYLLLCFMIGNDFLPHVPSLHIGEGSIDFILECYGEVFNGHHETTGLISEDGEIDIDKFTRILEVLAREEDEMVKSFYKSHIRKKYGETSNLSKMDSEIRRIEFLPLVKRVPDTVHFNEAGWEDRYYKRYLCCNNIQSKDIDKLCKNYCEGLIWCYNYYTKECVSWEWYYKFSCAPTTKDLHSYFQRNLFSNNINFKKSVPLEPVQQLLCILPPASSYLIKYPERNLMISDDSIIRDLFPNSFNIEMLYMRYFHESIPQLPIINVDRLKEAIELIRVK